MENFQNPPILFKMTTASLLSTVSGNRPTINSALKKKKNWQCKLYNPNDIYNTNRICLSVVYLKPNLITLSFLNDFNETQFLPF